MMAGTKQTWRHFCLRADDISVQRKIYGHNCLFQIPKHVLVQGCATKQMDVLIPKRFQGAFNCIPEIVTPPAHGSLLFTGTGWEYTPTGVWVDDEFTYVVKVNHLVSNLGTCTILK